MTGSRKVLQIVVRSLDFTLNTMQDFPAGAGNMGSISGLGRSDMLKGSVSNCLPQLLRLRFRARKPQLQSPCVELLKCTHLEPVPYRKRSPRSEKLERETRKSPRSAQPEKARAEQWRPNPDLK